MTSRSSSKTTSCSHVRRRERCSPTSGQKRTKVEVGRNGSWMKKLWNGGSCQSLTCLTANTVSSFFPKPHPPIFSLTSFSLCHSTIPPSLHTEAPSYKASYYIFLHRFRRNGSNSKGIGVLGGINVFTIRWEPTEWPQASVRAWTRVRTRF